jgi:hypothetical protein
VRKEKQKMLLVPFHGEGLSEGMPWAGVYTSASMLASSESGNSDDKVEKWRDLLETVRNQGDGVEPKRVDPRMIQPWMMIQ